MIKRNVNNQNLHMVDTCVRCNKDIYENEKYYDINGRILCEKCANLKEFENLKECFICGEGETLYKYHGKYYCAECLLELLEQNKEIETFHLGTGYMVCGEWIGDDQNNDLDEIVNELDGYVDIEKVQ